MVRRTSVQVLSWMFSFLEMVSKISVHGETGLRDPKANPAASSSHGRWTTSRAVSACPFLSCASRSRGVGSAWHISADEWLCWILKSVGTWLKRATPSFLGGDHR